MAATSAPFANDVPSLPESDEERTLRQLRMRRSRARKNKAFAFI
jgi:hypothetical protein